VLGALPPPIAKPAVATAPVVKAPEPPAERRIQVSGELQEAMLLVMVKPDYPLLAKEARIQGTVCLSAIIDKEGKIAELKVISGHPMLVGAAVAATKKWRYRPTLQGGAPVEVATQITVRFHLANSGG
jgi:protein TonB